jgi:hypothetical protein
METGTGTCHCQAVRFEVDLEEGLAYPCRSNPRVHGFNVASIEGVDPMALGPIAIGDGAAQSPASR